MDEMSDGFAGDPRSVDVGYGFDRVHLLESMELWLFVSVLLGLL
jgi:hypothetical protein